MMHSAETIIIRHTKDGTRVASAGNTYRFLASRDETNGKFSALECLIEPGKGAPFHTHTREEEAFLVTNGEMVFYTSENRIVAPIGTFISCPVGTKRGFRNESMHPATMIVFLAPAGMEQMFILDGTALEDGQNASDLSGLRQAECPTLSTEFGIVNHDDPLPDAGSGHVCETTD